MVVHFRIAGAGDIAAVRAITKRAYAAWLPVLGYPPEPVTADHQAWIADGKVLLACDGETAVGLVEVEPGEVRDLVYNLAVDPGHAGKGIGRTLLAEAERRAAAAGKAAVWLYTNALMERNIALYASLGYRETGRRPNPARPGFTIVEMEKPVPAPPPGPR
ncbi:GNAT family N-acetyltransferase [Marinibaculum pumilum]|uniref:GNAT family N-acetyltransferase n=1 Tax=Marinibaculum pumilum TaxID=1766165 RepID=A0ABV7L558_9PROT